MFKPKLKHLIESIVDEVLEEQNTPKVDLANEYVKKIRIQNPEMYDILMHQALFAIKATKSDEKPRDHIETIHKLLRAVPEADPRASADTHGVRLFIDHIMNQEVNPDQDLIGKIKRFYQMSIDGLLKDTYGTEK